MSIHVFIPQQLRAAHQQLESRIQNTLENIQTRGTYRGLNLERLAAQNGLCSIRLNDKSRLVVHIPKQYHGTVWIVVDALPEHEYQKLKNKSRDHLNRFLERFEDELNEFLVQREKESISKTTENQNELITVQHLARYNQQVVSLSELQQNMLETEQLPVFINGAAGSGKTLLAQEMLLNLAANSDVKSVLYIVKSDHVARAMKQNINAQNGSSKICIKTLSQLILESDPSLKQEQLVDDNNLINFLKQRIKIAPKSVNFTLSIELMVREIKANICSSVPLDGARHSLASDNPELKQFLSDTFNAYKKQLALDGKIHPDFYDFNIQPCDAIFVDEAQDFSAHTLMLLKQAANNHQIAVFGDMNQDLDASLISNTRFIREIICNSRIVHLPVVHRCPIAVIDAVNQLLQLKAQFLKGVLDQDTIQQLEQPHVATPGRLTVLQNSQALLDSVDQDFWGPETAVISMQSKTEAYETPLVFDVATIKGLEFDTIVLDQPFDIKVMRLLQETLENTEPQPQSEETTARLMQHLVRRDIFSDEKYHQVALFINQLFTALTRAKTQVIIVQDTTHPLLHLFIDTILKNNEQPTITVIENNSATPSTLDDTSSNNLDGWKQRYEELMDRGEMTIAEQILQQKIHLHEPEWKSDRVFVNTNQPELPEELSTMKQHIARKNRKKKPTNTSPTNNDIAEEELRTRQFHLRAAKRWILSLDDPQKKSQEKQKHAQKKMPKKKNTSKSLTSTTKFDLEILFSPAVNSKYSIIFMEAFTENFSILKKIITKLKPELCKNILTAWKNKLHKITTNNIEAYLTDLSAFYDFLIKQRNNQVLENRLNRSSDPRTPEEKVLDRIVSRFGEIRFREEKPIWIELTIFFLNVISQHYQMADNKTQQLMRAIYHELLAIESLLPNPTNENESHDFRDQLFEHLSPEIMIITADEEGTPSIFSLLCSESGHSLLQSWLKKNKDFALLLASPEFLLNIPITGPFKGCSPLLLLSLTPNGKKCIKLLFDTNPKLVNSITPEVLFTQADGEKIKHTTLFLQLSICMKQEDTLTNAMHALLHKFFSNNQGAIEQLTTDHLNIIKKINKTINSDWDLSLFISTSIRNKKMSERALAKAIGLNFLYKTDEITFPDKSIIENLLNNDRGRELLAFIKQHAHCNQSVKEFIEAESKTIHDLEEHRNKNENEPDSINNLSDGIGKKLADDELSSTYKLEL